MKKLNDLKQDLRVAKLNKKYHETSVEYYISEINLLEKAIEEKEQWFSYDDYLKEKAEQIEWLKELDYQLNDENIREVSELIEKRIKQLEKKQ